MSDIKDDLPKGPNCLHNYTEKELFENGKLKHWNVWNCNSISTPYRPTFLIRMHNLEFKRVAEKYPEDRFQRQDLVINVSRGDKITLGQNCSSNKYGFDEVGEQEIDLDLKGDCFSPFVAETHCKISRFADEDKVWIKDLDTQQGTFLNGRKLTPNIYNGLENGDIVSLGISHLNPRVRLSEGKFWVFKFMEVSREEENHRKELISQTFGNPVILSNILSHIYLNKVWELRHVSKFWNQIALPILRSSLPMSLCIGLQQMIHDNLIPKSQISCLDEFKRKAEVFESLGLQKLYLHELSHGDFMKQLYKIIDEAKLLENFFIICKNQILKVTLAFTCDISERKYEYKRKVIQALFKECVNLQEIEIVNVDLSEILEAGMVTSAIRKIMISHQQIDIEKFLKLFPNIVELKIKDISFLKSFISFATKKNNEKFIKQFLGSLKVINLAPLYRGSLDSEIVKSLSTIPVKIEELNLNGLRLDPNSAADLSNALSGFGNSVRKLILGIIELSKENIEAGFFFPKMERLENLHIFVAFSRYRHRWKFIFESENCGPNLQFSKIEDQLPDQFHGVHPAEMLMMNILNDGGKKQFPKLKSAIVAEYPLISENYAHLLKDNLV